MRTQALVICSMLLLAGACGSDDLTVQTPPTDGTVSPRPPASPTSSRPPLDGVADPPGGSSAAARLRAEPECGLGNEPVTHLSWRPARDPGRAQAVVATAFANGFETGNFEVSPRLPADASTFDWTGTTPNGAYAWRVMTRHGGTWVPSKVSSFIGPSCGVPDTG